MKNITKLVTRVLDSLGSRRIARTHPRKWILGFCLAAALLSWGCPKQDPLQAFSPPPTPVDQGPAPVPEPATALLFGAALLIGGAIVRRRRNAGHK